MMVAPFVVVGGKKKLTAEGGERAEHATVLHALWLAWVIVAHTCDFSGVGAVVQHIQHLVTREAPICAQRDEDLGECKRTGYSNCGGGATWLRVPASQSPRFATQRFSCAGSTRATSAVVP